MKRSLIWTAVAGALAVPLSGAEALAQDTPPAAPAAPAAQSTPARDQEIEELRRVIEQLKKRVDELEKRQPAAPTPGAPGTVPPATPDPQAPTDPPVPDIPPATLPPSRTGGGGGAIQLPNISVVGNIIGAAGDTKAVPSRGRSTFDELEVAFQDAVSSKLRYDVFLSAEKAEEWRFGMEEGFLTATGIMPGLNVRAGRIRTPLGRFNPWHPHQWLFITQPSANAALLGEHGLVADGALLQYVLPFRGLYAALEFGRWETTTHAHEEEEHAGEDDHGGNNNGGNNHNHAARARRAGFRGPGIRRLGMRRVNALQAALDPHDAELGFRGGDSGAYHARLALGKALTRTQELELGMSRYWGRGEVEGYGRRMLAVNGLDLSYRSYPSAYERWWLLAELYNHETSRIRGETKQRPGGFATLAYRWNQFWEAGVRGDYTKYPFPIGGHELGGSVFLTRYINEQTSLRLEYRRANVPEFGDTNALYFQVLFGSGPHSHPLQ